jgi:K+-transporting ATPase ATPase C chain
VAKARGLAPQTLAALVRAQTQSRLFGLIGEPRVNVLKLNLALDALQASMKSRPKAPKIQTG